MKIKIFIGCNKDLINYQKSFDFIQNKINQSDLSNESVEIIDSPSSRFEYPALHKMWEDSQSEDLFGLYLHCKGSSKPDGVQFENGLAWLEYMIYGLIDNSDTCINHLNSGADIVGSMWYRHFKGNCFWFRSDYLRGLKNPLELDQNNRYQAEYWIAQHYWWGGYRYPKVKNLFYIPIESDNDFLKFKLNNFVPEINEKNKCCNIEYVIQNNHFSVYDELEISVDDNDKYKNIIEKYINYNSNVIIKTNKFSVVIPTMWKSDTTIDLLNLYEKCEYVDEIIIVDNNKNNRPSGLDLLSKLKIIGSQGNLYVNKSWNVGVNESRNDLIAISNDDILFKPEDVFSSVSHIGGWGAIGMASSNFQDGSSAISIENGNDICSGWGCLIFVKKSQWVNIPDNIKIWYGDNWIVKTCEENRLPVMKLKADGLIKTKMSTTSGNACFSEIIQNDTLEWEKIK